MSIPPRKYSLPNCTLSLEGLGNPGLTGSHDSRPLMTILLNAECYFPVKEQAIRGGREFFQSLVTAASYYAQEVLSGVHNPLRDHIDQVKLERTAGNLHRLLVKTPVAGADSPDNGKDSAATLQEIYLSTVELFDLVEAIDQFFADTQTLPDLQVQLAPVSRHAVARPPLDAEKTVPLVLGLSTLAVASVALFLLPVPRVNRPLDPNAPQAQTTPTASPSPKPGTAASPPSLASPVSPAAKASPTPTISPLAVSPTASPAATTPPSLESTLSKAKEITDRAELERLNKKISASIEAAWQNRSAVKAELVYRLGVGQDGAIVGYKPENEAAIANIGQTPLLDLTYIPTGGRQVTPEAIGQFRVVFSPDGQLQISPWNQPVTAAASPSVAPRPSPATSPTATLATDAEITDSAQLRELNLKVYNQIDQNWRGKPPFTEDLEFQVRTNAQGVIVGYEPLNPAAKVFVESIPLPQLTRPSTTQEPIALFRVVFKPKGILQSSPWRGAP